MKNWKIIVWLILFFPVGLYLMFKHSNWSKEVKYGVGGLFALLILASRLGGWVSLISIVSFAAIVLSILSFAKNKNRKQSIGIMLLGVILFGFSYQYTAAQEAEQARIEQQEQEAEQARIEQQEAKEHRLEMARQQRIAKKEKEKKLKEQIATAIEKVNAEPTEANYLQAMSLIEQLSNSNSQLIKELEELRPTVDEYEESLKVAQEAVEQAESDLTRESYDEASELVTALSSPNSALVTRLEGLDTELIEIEEKEEEERLAKEQQEAERVAAEEAQQKTEQEAQVKAAQTAEPAPETNTEKVVYIAPDSGTKYHLSANCRGLNNANSVQEIDLSVAKSQGYGLCGWEK